MSVCNVKFSLQMLQQGLKFDFFGAAAVQMVFFHFFGHPPPWSRWTSVAGRILRKVTLL